MRRSLLSLSATFCQPPNGFVTVDPHASSTAPGLRDISNTTPALPAVSPRKPTGARHLQVARQAAPQPGTHAPHVAAVPSLHPPPQRDSIPAVRVSSVPVRTHLPASRRVIHPREAIPYAPRRACSLILRGTSAKAARDQSSTGTTARRSPTPAPSTASINAPLQRRRGTNPPWTHRADPTYARRSPPYALEQVRGAQGLAARQAQAVRRGSPGVRPATSARSTGVIQQCPVKPGPTPSSPRRTPAEVGCTAHAASGQAPRAASSNSTNGTARSRQHRVHPRVPEAPRVPGHVLPCKAAGSAPNQRLSPSRSRWSSPLGDVRNVAFGASRHGGVCPFRTGERCGARRCPTGAGAGEW